MSIVNALGSAGMNAAISGFEDHSVSVVGNDQLVTYDDSNVFIARNGQINANTGDTDSSGLNAVDVVDSRVRSGNSGDGEGTAEDPQDPEDPEALVARSTAADTSGGTVSPTVFPAVLISRFLLPASGRRR